MAPTFRVNACEAPTPDYGFGGPWGRFEVGFGAWFPAVDVINRDSEVVVRIDLPGLDRKDVQLAVEPEMLHLRGARRTDTSAAPGDAYHCLERWAGPVTRTIRLPAEVDTGQMMATVTHGVLEVRLPKRGAQRREHGAQMIKEVASKTSDIAGRPPSK